MKKVQMQFIIFFHELEQQEMKININGCEKLNIEHNEREKTRRNRLKLKGKYKLMQQINTSSAHIFATANVNTTRWHQYFATVQHIEIFITS